MYDGKTYELTDNDLVEDVITSLEWDDGTFFDEVKEVKNDNR